MSTNPHYPSAKHIKQEHSYPVQSALQSATPTSLGSNATDEPHPESILDFDRLPDVALRIILSNFNKLGLLQLLGIQNTRWRNLVYAALHCHTKLTLFISPENDVTDGRYLQFNIESDHLTPPSRASTKCRPEFFRFDQINSPVFNWIRYTFPQIRHLEVQFRPTFLTTVYLHCLLREYSQQLISLKLSFIGYKFTPYSFLMVINAMPSLKHLTLHGLSCVFESGVTLSVIKQLETFHFSLDVRPGSHRTLMTSITDVTGNVPILTLDAKGYQPNGEEMRELPVRIKSKIVKLRLNLLQSQQIEPALANCAQLRVLTLFRVSNINIEHLFQPLVKHTGLRHLKFDLTDLDLTSFAMRNLLTPGDISRFIVPLPSITSLTISITTTNHNCFTLFPFADFFTEVKWIRVHYSKFLCPHHNHADAEQRRQCNRVLMYPLGKCPKLEKIYAFSFKYRPHAHEQNAALFLQNDAGYHYEWTAGEWNDGGSEGEGERGRGRDGFW